MKTTINLSKADLRNLVNAEVEAKGMNPNGDPTNIQFQTSARAEDGLTVTVEVGVTQQPDPLPKKRAKPAKKDSISK